MDRILAKLPPWLLGLALGFVLLYVVVLVSYAVFDGRAVTFWPPMIAARGESSGRPLPPSAPWISLTAVPVAFADEECGRRFQEAFGIAQVQTGAPAAFGGQYLWTGHIDANTVALFCPGIGAVPMVIIGAAGPEVVATKTAVDRLAGVLRTGR